MQSARDLRPIANSAGVSSYELHNAVSCGGGRSGSGLGARALLREDICRVTGVEPEFQVPRCDLPLSWASHAHSTYKVLAPRNFAPCSEGESHEMTGGRGGLRGIR